MAHPLGPPSPARSWLQAASGGAAGGSWVRPSVAPERPIVVLLHGLNRTERFMAPLRRSLERAGWPTWATTYPSHRATIGELADEVAARLRRDHPRGELMAVTHSLGGILVRHLATAMPWRGLVMIAPPNRGSRLALAMRHLSPYRWVAGPAGQEIADGSGWPDPPRPFAVIAGVRGRSLRDPVSWISRGLGVLPADVPSDGTLAVEETKLPGMADFATVEATHNHLLDHPLVHVWVRNFLEHGRLR